MSKNITTDSRKKIIQRELQWHETEAHRRYPIDKILYDSPVFDSITQSAMSYLEPESGEHIIDLACGEGKETLRLAQAGLNVFSIDLSHMQLQRVRQLIQKDNIDLNVHFIQANAEQLPFATSSFRCIHGKAIIHHLDINIAAQEINRVLQPAGKATFAEPMRQHPIISLGRRLTPKLRTVDEHPLTFKQMEEFAHIFPEWHIDRFFLTTPLAYIFRLVHLEFLFRQVFTLAQKLDSLLFKHIKITRNYAWYSSINIKTKS